MAVYWNLDDDGILTIQGEGRMPDYGCGGRAMAPWNDEKDRICRISICEGITEIGMRAFEGCDNLQSVDLPETLAWIHSRAFYNCKNLVRVRTAAKNTQFTFLYAPGMKAWKERRRLERLAKEQAEQAEAAKRKKEKEQEGKEADAQNGKKELTPAEQREKNGQVLLKVRKDKNGQTLLEVWKDKNGRLVEVRTGRYGQIVEVRKDKNGRVLEVRKIKNGQVLKPRSDRSGSAEKKPESAEKSTEREQAVKKGDAVLQGDRRRRPAENPEIRFGLNSFYNVPWAREQFGDFYIANGALYACFSGEKELTIPEGVLTLEKFAFKDTEAESIRLPQTLKIIRAFAFADSGVQSLEIPDSVTRLEDYAFADSRLTYLEFSAESGCRVREGTFYKSSFTYKKCANGLPELFEVKAIPESKKYGGFRALRVAKKKPKSGKDGSPAAGVYGATRIDVARNLFRKMTSGRILLMIRWEEGRIIRVESFFWDKEEKLISEYLMYPCVDGNGISIYRDSFTWQEKEDFLDAFDMEDATALEEEGILRRLDEGCEEQWFASSDGENFGGPLELELLRYWNRVHAAHVDTVAECADRFGGISFVPI